MFDLSIVILVYNSDRYIEQCLLSVCTQRSLEDLSVQLVVMDDASSDNTKNIIEQTLSAALPQNWHLNFVSNEKNLGCYNNLRKGIALAKGSYIAYLEGDDYWTSKTKLIDQYCFLVGNPDTAGIGGQCRFVDQNGHEIERKYYALKEDTTFEHFKFWGYPPFQTSSFMFRASALPPLPDDFEGTCSNDKIMYLFVSSHGNIVYKTEEVSAYRFHPDNVSHKVSLKEVMLEHLKINRLMLKHLLGIRIIGYYLIMAIVYRLIYWKGKD